MYKIFFYAQLKDYFGDSTTVETEQELTPAALRAKLAENNPLARDWLMVARIASEDEFCSEETKLPLNATYYFLPPSSGG